MKQTIKPVIAVFFIVILAALPLSAAATEKPDDDKTLSPYFFIENGESGVDHFPLKKTDVSVQISGVIADVVITQRYTNDGSRPINARYIFPASTQRPRPNSASPASTSSWACFLVIQSPLGLQPYLPGQLRHLGNFLFGKAPRRSNGQGPAPAAGQVPSLNADDPV